VAKYKVVIAGGGFAGVKAALMLAKYHILDVTLIYNRPDFQYHPKLYETATGGMNAVSSIPISEIFARLPLDLVQDNIKSIDRQAHRISTKSGRQFSYDALILGLGVVPNYCGIKGLEKFAYGIKTIDDAVKFKNHLHRQIIDDSKPDLNYVVIGGGPSGIELAGVLPHYIRQILKNHELGPRQIHVDLIEAAPCLIPFAPKTVSKKIRRRLRKLGVRIYFDTKVEAETADALVINDKPIQSHTVVWAAGTVNHPFFTDQGFQLSANGKVRVDQYLQAEPGIYVVGDNADTPFSGMAQTAIYDGAFVAGNIIRKLDNKQPKPYVAKQPIYVFPTGPNWAAVIWGPVRIFGRPGSWLRKCADFTTYREFEPWHMAAERFYESYDHEESCPVCATNTQMKV